MIFFDSKKWCCIFVFVYMFAWPRIVCAQEFVPVVWAGEGIHVEADGTIVRNAEDTESQWGHSGARSIRSIPSDDQGEVQMTVYEKNKGKIFGLSALNESHHYKTINYGIYLNPRGRVLVYENGERYPPQTEWDFGSYNTGDHMSVQKIAGQIVYKKNGTMFHQTPVVDSEVDLFADCAFLMEGATLGKVEIKGASLPQGSRPIIIKKNLYANVNASTTFILEAETTAGTEPVFQIATFPVHGTVDVSALPEIVYTPHAGYFGWDQLGVIVNDGIRTSPEIFLDIYVGAQPIEWVREFNVFLDEHIVVRGSDWPEDWGNSGARSKRLIEQDGGVIVTAVDEDGHRMVGLGAWESDTDWGFTSMDHAILLRGGEDDAVRIFEKGVRLGEYSSYQPGDRFSIERIGNQVIYKKNGQEFERSPDPQLDEALIVDSAFFSDGATIGNGHIMQASYPFRRGDANSDGTVNIADAIRILGHLFNIALPQSHPDRFIACLDAADSNDDGTLNVADAIDLLGFLFNNDNPPEPPGEEQCGFDPTPDELPCLLYAPPCN